MKDKYVYMVSYFHKKGVGRQMVGRKHKIRKPSDISIIESIIAADGTEGVVVTNFILLDTKWGVWDWFVALVEMALLSFCILSIIASIFV